MDRKAGVVYDWNTMNAVNNLLLNQPKPVPRRPWSKVGVACFVLLFWLAGALTGLASISPVPPPTEETPTHSDLLLVGLTPSLSPAQTDRLFADAGLTIVRHWPEFGLAAVRVPTSNDSRSREEAHAAARARLTRQPGVRYVEPDLAIESAALPYPNDPRLPEQWALDKINMPAAWQITAGDPNLIVALIDSGLEVTHEDLAGISLWTNEVEAAGLPGEDDDANGYVDDFHGWDWIGSVNTFSDPFGHGTHVGGILTARTDNGVGVASVGRNLTLMPLRVLDNRGSGFVSYLVDALAYTQRHGARIINLSLVLRSDSLAVGDAVRSVVQTGGLVVAATGNNGTYVYWPAAYPETLAVAATTADDTRAIFSNPGPQTDLAAPGAAILSTYRNNAYHLNDGTSMATPHVSGLAALVWSLRPDWDWAQVKNHLKATAVDMNVPGPDNEMGAGRIDAEVALISAGAGVSFTVDYRVGQYLRVNQTLALPVQLAVTDTHGGLLPVVGAFVHYNLLVAPEVGAGVSAPISIVSGTHASDSTGWALLQIPMPSAVGRYDLQIRMAGQERNYPLLLQDGPLLLAGESLRAMMSVGGEQNQLLFSAQTGESAGLLQEPLHVELRTNLGHFADGSQQRTLWMVGGLLTETLISGSEAGVAEVMWSAGGQSQRLFVSIQPGPTQRMQGASPLFVQDWGAGATATIRLELEDGYGNPIWGNRRVNFYGLHGTFAPQSPTVVLGVAETQLSLPGWLPARVEYWAMVPGTFAVFRGEVVVLRHHLWLPQIEGSD